MIELQEKAERPEGALIVEVDTGEYDVGALLVEMYGLARGGWGEAGGAGGEGVMTVIKGMGLKGP